MIETPGLPQGQFPLSSVAKGCCFFIYISLLEGCPVSFLLALKVLLGSRGKEGVAIRPGELGVPHNCCSLPWELFYTA